MFVCLHARDLSVLINLPEAIPLRSFNEKSVSAKRNMRSFLDRDKRGSCRAENHLELLMSSFDLMFRVDD